MKWINVYSLCDEDCYIVDSVIRSLTGQPADGPLQNDVELHIEKVCGDIGCEPNDAQAVKQTLVDLFE